MTVEDPSGETKQCTGRYSEDQNKNILQASRMNRQSGTMDPHLSGGDSPPNVCSGSRKKGSTGIYPSCYKQSWQNSTNFVSLCVSRGSEPPKSSHEEEEEQAFAGSGPTLRHVGCFVRAPRCWLLCHSVRVTPASARSEFSDSDD